MKFRTKPELMRAYNINSTIYEEQRFVTPGGKYLDNAEKQKILSLLKAGSVLEVGAGTCRYGSFLMKNGFAYTGIDISKGMLMEAKKNVDGINIVQGDGEVLCFKPSSFDNVICVHALRFIDPSIYFKEIYDLLKPEGVVVGQFDSSDNIYTKISLLVKKLSGTKVKMDFYSYDEIETITSHIGYSETHAFDMFNFPNSFYHRFPQHLIDVMKVLDKVKLKNGNIILAVCNKGK